MMPLNSKYVFLSPHGYICFFCIIVYRENEVLKHQLRKYVSAVQMLKRDDADHSYEAQLYESKLVQVGKFGRTQTSVSCLSRL